MAQREEGQEINLKKKGVWGDQRVKREIKRRTFPAEQAHA
jgi:hypothetical protein